MQYKCNCTKIFYSEILLHEDPKTFFFCKNLKKIDRKGIKMLTKYLPQQKPETEVPNKHQKNHLHTSKLQPLVVSFSPPGTKLNMT